MLDNRRGLPSKPNGLRREVDAGATLYQLTLTTNRSTPGDPSVRRVAASVVGIHRQSVVLKAGLLVDGGTGAWSQQHQRECGNGEHPRARTNETAELLRRSSTTRRSPRVGITFPPRRPQTEPALPTFGEQSRSRSGADRG